MTTDSDIHATALERYAEADGAWKEIYDEVGNNIDFLLNAGNAQWADGRDYNPKKLKLVINKCPAFVNNIVNEMRASRPAASALPADDKADVETAEVIKGLIRNTETVSDAASAYDTAGFLQVAGGLGWLRINVDWVPGTFDQEPSIEAVPDYSSVLIDPLSRAIDGSDMRYAFIVRPDMPREEFEQRYPDATPVDFGSSKGGWNTDKTVRIAEYFYIDTERRKIHLLENGQVVTDDMIEQYDASGLAAQLGPMSPIVRTREEDVRRVKWCKINGHEILEKTDWLGEHIPVVPVYGNLVFNRGKRHVFGLMHVLKDPQRLANYWESANAEIIALQPVAPWTAFEGQIEDYEQQWAEANQKNYPVLVSKPVYDKAGNVLPPPQRQMPPQASAAMTQQIMMAGENMKIVTGIYDPSMGAESNETSGRAILARQRQGDTASYHYIDNQSKSVRMVAKQLVDLYGKLYTGPQIKRILGDDGKDKIVKLNQPTDITRDGQKGTGIHDINAGRYDVVVHVGPSFASKRQESLEAMFELSRVMPQVMAAGADLIVRNIDAPGMEDLAKRLRKTLPPGMADDEQTPEQQALAQAGKAVEMLQSQLADMERRLAEKAQSEAMKYDIDLKTVEIKKQEADIKAFQAQIEAYRLQAEQQAALPREALMSLIQQISDLSARSDDIAGALDLLLSADEGEPPQPVQ